MEEFINLHQGVMSVHEYSLNFTMLSEYAPLFVSDTRDEISCFLTGVSDYYDDIEFQKAMLHENIIISHIVIHAKHVEDTRSR